MKIRIEQFNPVIGDLSGNTARISELYAQAAASELDVIIFPELSLCGYPPMDLLERRDFIRACSTYADQLSGITKKNGPVLIFGAPVPNEKKVGRPLFNSAVICSDGEIQSLIHKTLLPTYDVFDEFRYFEPNRVWEPVTIKGVSVGITICEDLWNNQNEVEYHKYDINPAMLLKDAGAEIIVNISASPFTKRKPELRETMLRGHARASGLPVVYANQVGANTEIIFDGDSMCVNPDGTIVGRLPLFQESGVDVVLSKDAGTGKFSASSNRPNAGQTSREERIFKALVLGLKDYMRKTGISDKVVLGLSGGIDSALTAVIAAEAIGPENVHAITMPSEFSSEGSVGDSRILAENLSIQFEQIPIGSLYDHFLETLKPVFRGTEFGVTEENIQSRTRGVILMALSNKFGYLLLNTGNKSEVAVGYCTLYGDMAGGLSVLSDVYKTEVYAVCRWLNEEYYGREVIPQNIITKPPSAELRPDQKDSDSLPDYDFLDRVLEKYVEAQDGIDNIIEQTGEADLVRRIIRMVDLNEYKRRQAAPGLRVSAKAFGIGRRLPIAQRWNGDLR